jgi:hypothetical protein
VLNLAGVASRTGRAPSELLGIGCRWCAYCVDEALMIRMDRSEEAAAAEEAVEGDLAARRARLGSRT